MRISAATLAAGLFFAGSATAQDVMRHKIPNSDFPIAQAVEVPAGKTTVYVSGAVPSVVDEKADKTTIAAYGDTKAQTESVFKSIEKTLDGLGLKMGDVVKMQVFLVGDPPRAARWIWRLHGGLHPVFRHRGAAEPAVALGDAGGRPG